MSKKTEIVLSPDAEEVYKYLVEKSDSSKFERIILNAINKKKDLIKSNIHYGEPIAKKKFPDEYVEKYNITNLFWVELPHGWRMLYTLTNADTEVEIIAFVLDIFDHKKYDKKMDYK